MVGVVLLTDPRAPRSPPSEVSMVGVRQALHPVLRDTLDEDDGDTLGEDDLGLVMVMASVAAVLILSPPGMGHPWGGADDQPLGESGASSRPPVSAAMTCHGDAAGTPSRRVSAAAACPSASTASASTEPRGGIGPRLGSAR
jgi:hypothetical protein